MQLAALFHPKAGLWVQGRRNWPSVLRSRLQDQEKKGPWIWFHCASLGEFEQGRNLLEHIRREHPQYRILLTFFSPSGYEIRKEYAHADLVCYLPLDTHANVREWFSIFEIHLAFFVKYELWLSFLSGLAERQIPTLLVSARFDASSSFVRSPMAKEYKKAFAGLTHIFTQDEITRQTLQQIGIRDNVSRSSDTRFDRVSSNIEEWQEVAGVSQFKQSRLCIVAGSSWPKGEDLLFQCFDRFAERLDLCMIIAPHEINQARIASHCQARAEQSIRYSEIEQLSPEHRILWIDNIGMLSRLYAYADVAYVG
ncbi:MAG: glycosyltransferase N-terminal domain-containing protein, partial [Bacteroidota bacterium]